MAKSAFTDGLLPSLSDHLARCTTGSLGPVNGIDKDVSGNRLPPTTVFTYPVD